ncbi:EEF1A lysine methyltransferase 2-like [Zingiber officinale]|uniref:EEF1A lysine methyltransferase 2-like n=1 Tax=Zingiber officinale TaxID=94328 RepID=UPI001C4B44BE|nr:EEF1A lysine methyltransferase 2-like [Zingiber officinale]
MAGVRWPPEDSDLNPPRPAAATAAAAAAEQMISDDDRSVAADSWSIKSEYGSTLDDEQRHADAVDMLSGCNFPAASDYSSDKEGPDSNEVEASLLGLQSYWDASYAEDLANFLEHNKAGEIWFGIEVMETVATWTKTLCANISQPHKSEGSSNSEPDPDSISKDLSSWGVLDIGTGNGLLLQELAKQGFSDLTGTDYSEGAIVLAQKIATRNGFPNINFMVDDVLETKLNRKFLLVMDKGTLDAIGLHPDGQMKRLMYWESVSNLVASGGILVITSCNSTKDELLQEVENFNHKTLDIQDLDEDQEGSDENVVFQYLDHVRTYPTILFGGIEGSRVCTVAFQRL